MSVVAKKIFIVGAKRTPFGAFGGTLKGYSPTQLGAHAAKAALDAAGVAPELVDTVVIGNVQQTGNDAAYLARHVGLEAGIPQEVPALTVNRLCGSGFQACVNVAQDMLCGDAEIGIAGGAECMSQAPYVLRGTRWGTPLGVDNKLIDSLWEGLTDKREKMPMAMTAEKLAEQCGVDRAEADVIAHRSQVLWKEASDAGRFTAELAPMEVKGRRGMQTFDTDEHPRPEATLESVGKLKALFKPDGGTVTAGNASGISDGAAVLVLATEEAVAKHGLTPLARLVGWHYAGVDPTIMGIGPVPAIKGLLEKTGKELKDIDRLELNEAFASQYVSCEKELGLDRSKVNVNGGAIAMGHPTGASGARITGHLAHQMAEDKDIKLAIGAACIGGGQGIALLLESC